VSNPSISKLERAALVLATFLRDDEVFIVGGASAVPLAAALVAQEFHAPDLVLLTGSGAVNPKPEALPLSGGSGELVNTAEALIDIDDIFDFTEVGKIDTICLGGIQVDRFGNFNLTAIGSYEAPRLRGPGMANVGLTMTASRLCLFVPHPSARSLVPRVDYPTGYGSRRPDGESVDQRSGGGPEFLLTPDALFEFTGPNGEAVLVATSEQVSVADVASRTSWDVSPESVDTFPAIDAEQLAYLRSLDATGLLA